MKPKTYLRFMIILILGLLSACGPLKTEQADSLVIASTTIIGDVVRAVGGDMVNLHVLLPTDADPHSFSPSPQDVALIEKASLIFLNGFNLEESLANLVEANAKGEIVIVSDGVQPIFLEGSEHDEADDPDHLHPGADPHVWMNPANVKIWVENITRELSELKPENETNFQQHATNYLKELDELHTWSIAQVNQIPPEKRMLVTDHDSLGYFADAYGFKIIGVVIPGGSTLSDPSAQQIAALEEEIELSNTPAIFVGTTVNTQLAERVGTDTGATLVPLYTGSLSREDGPAPTYIEMMQYNVKSIVEALQ